MNIPAESTSPGDPPSVSLRPEQPGDEGFLYEVYASTREEELALTNWDETMRRAFLTQQFSAMRQGYRNLFPTGEFSIIELAGKPAGRMVVHKTDKEIRVVDVALLPAYRNQGIGTWLMQQVCATADRPVRLTVLKQNRALVWYARLGFTKVGDLEIYEELEWRPELKPAPPRG